MFIVSGYVVFDESRKGIFNNNGVAQIPVSLVNNNNKSLTVLTDINGKFEFINVENGDYTLIESYGFDGVISSDGDFLNALENVQITPNDPPINFVNNTLGANTLDSISPNVLKINVLDNNVEDIYFFDAPINHNQANIKSYVNINNVNLITNAGNGNFGENENGALVNNSPLVNPFLNINDLNYKQISEANSVLDVSDFTVTNIYKPDVSLQDNFWTITDLNSKNEKGAMLVANTNLDNILFEENVVVDLNSDYLLRFFVVDLNKVNETKNLSVSILDLNNNVKHTKNLQISSSSVVPTWSELCVNFNTLDLNQIKVQILSDDETLLAIDNIRLNKIEIPQITLVKEADKQNVLNNNLVTYKTTFKANLDMTNVFFKDIITEGAEFYAPNKIKLVINNSEQVLENKDPNVGFDLTLNKDDEVAISFDVKVNNNFTKELLNVSTLTYDFSVDSESGFSYEKISNQTKVYVAGGYVYINELVGFINNTLVNLDCNEICKDINNAIDEFSVIIEKVRDYVEYELENNKSIKECVFEDFSEFVEIVDSLVQITNLIGVNNRCDKEFICTSIDLLFNISLSFIQVLEFIQTMLSYTEICEPLKTKLIGIIKCEFAKKLEDFCSYVYDFKKLLVKLVQKIQVPKLKNEVKKETSNVQPNNFSMPNESTLNTNQTFNSTFNPNFSSNFTSSSFNPYSYNYSQRTRFNK